MLTACDRYWWRLNRDRALLLLCTLPLALIFPAVSLIAPAVIFLSVCTRFLASGGLGEKEDDSLRFLLAMPFSRRQIFEAYRNGLVLLSLGWFALLALGRLALLAAGVTDTFFWNGPISSPYSILCALAVPAAVLLAVCFLMMQFLQNPTGASFTLYFCLVLLAVPIPAVILIHLKGVLRFATGFIMIRPNADYSTAQIMRMGLPPQAAAIIAVFLYFAVPGVLLAGFIFATRSARKSFVWEERVSR